MTLIFLSDVRAVAPESVIASGIFPEGLAGRICRGTGEAVKERVGAYALLSFAMEKYFGAHLSDTDIEIGKYGKPRLSDKHGSGRLNFNLSHGAGFAALVITDEGCEVGIDIEPPTDSARRERLESRMSDVLPTADKIERALDIAPLTVEMDTLGRCSESTTPTEIKTANGECFETRWTLLEALMKCDGRGFSAVKSSADLCRYMSVRSMKISYKDSTVYMSVAAQK